PSPTPTPTPRKWREFSQNVGRLTLVNIRYALDYSLPSPAGIFYYITHKERYLGTQILFDPFKKTLVVLGSSWGATSLLKGLDTEDYNFTIVISPKNVFLFTPLLPSVAVVMLNAWSILQHESPTHYITRHKARQVSGIDTEATSVVITGSSAPPCLRSHRTIRYDNLVHAVGAETQTVSIPGVKQHAPFMKEDAEVRQRQFLGCIEAAAFPGTSEEEERLLHMVVVGGGPTGIELTGELHDFLEEDIQNRYPEHHPYMGLTFVEALPSVLPMFSKKLIQFTERTFKESRIEIMTGTIVKGVTLSSVLLKPKDAPEEEVDCRLVEQMNKRGLVIDVHLRMLGAPSIFAIEDCTTTLYAPTGQVACIPRAHAQVDREAGCLENKLQQLTNTKVEGEEVTDEATTETETIKRKIERIKLKSFHHSHQGSLVYIRSDKAIDDLLIFWGEVRVSDYSAYLSTLFSLRNRATGRGVRVFPVYLGLIFGWSVFQGSWVFWGLGLRSSGCVAPGGLRWGRFQRCLLHLRSTHPLRCPGLGIFWGYIAVSSALYAMHGRCPVATHAKAVCVVVYP
ncbi:hypothetical protein HYDPIDRAFT_98074, partial [Hydnomerulius pinastri MD-312]